MGIHSNSGFFGFSDLGCSDLGCSDLACSDLGHCFFFVKIFTFFTQHSQLGNSFSTYPNGATLTKWNFYTLSHNNIHILTKRIAQYPFPNFLKTCKNFQKSKIKYHHSNPHTIVSLIYFLHQICTFSDTKPFLHPYPIFSSLLNLNFLT